jgi:hypothetical protein
MSAANININWSHYIPKPKYILVKWLPNEEGPAAAPAEQPLADYTSFSIEKVS